MRTAFFLFILTLSVPPAIAGDDTPQWARTAAAAKVPTFGPDVPGVVLLNEQQVTVDGNGRRTLTTRRAYRAITREGRKEAIAVEPYLTGTGKVKDLKAWLILPSGAVKKFGKESILDIAARDNDVYNEARLRVISGAGEADPGTVFAWEAVSEDRSIFSQFEFEFQDRLPALVSRFSLTLPAEWEAEARLFNCDDRKPEIAGNTWTWEMRDLPFIAYEDASPAVSGLAPRLGVTFFPRGNARNSVHAFASWRDVSRFQEEMSQGVDASDETILRTSKSLTTNAATELERIAAIGRFVQNIHYIEISTNLGRGGGYRPHSPSAVLEKRYGDCKDKANLMRAMLKAVGIPSRLVAIYSGDRTYTRPEWPSPHQFNHMIVAVTVGAGTQASSVAEFPILGRLLFFDPTDEVTPVGLLPGYEQDSLALVIAGADGALVRVPKAAPESNHVDRQTEIALAPRGSASVKFTEEARGEAASNMRRRFSRASEPEYLKYVERWLTATVSAPVIGKVSVPDSPTAAKTRRTVEFTSAQAGQLMQGRLLIFRPAMVSRAGQYDFAPPSRKYPVVLNSQSFSETVRVRMPEGFEVDEIPDPLVLNLPFANFESSCSEKDGVLTFRRSLLVRTATVPASQYAMVREFFGRVAAAEAGAVVLAKK